MKLSEFIRKISEARISRVDRAVAILWFHGLHNENSGLTAGEVCRSVEEAGCARQNVTVMRNLFRRDKRVIKGTGKTYVLSPEAAGELDQEYCSVLNVTPVIECDAVLAMELFENARGYIKKVVLQLNASYHYSLFDCCAVMCRRLLETLIIEVYEELDRADEIKDDGGCFLMFSALSDQIHKDGIVHLGRNTVNALKDFKRLGGLSAHNRRFNARKSDIDQIKNGLRISCEELLHLAGQGA